jgi:hypothetical protein
VVLNLKSLRKVEPEKRREILEGIPDTWLNVYDSDVVFLREGLFLRMDFLLTNFYPVFQERIDKIHKIEYSTKEEIKEGKASEKRVFEKKFGKI